MRRLDRAGRLCLSRSATETLGPLGWRICWHHLALLVVSDTAGTGPPTVVDSRGRLTVPVWLRHRSGDVLVGLDVEGPMLLIAPVEVLDRLGEVLAGAPR